MNRWMDKNPRKAAFIGFLVTLVASWALITFVFNPTPEPAPIPSTTLGAPLG